MVVVVPPPLPILMLFGSLPALVFHVIAMGLMLPLGVIRRFSRTICSDVHATMHRAPRHEREHQCRPEQNRCEFPHMKDPLDPTHNNSDDAPGKRQVVHL